MDKGFFNWVMKVKTYGPFSRKEVLWLAVSVLIMTFIFSFNDGADEFNGSQYFLNILLGMIAIVVAVVIHEIAHRIAAANLGYRVEYKPFFIGLVAGLVLTIMSNGYVIFLAYSSFYLDIMEKHRLGYFRHYLGYFDNGKVAVVGPLANLLAAIVFKTFAFMPEALVSKLVLVNALFAIYNILPIPPLDGAHVMFAARTLYPFIMFAVIIAGVLIIIPQIQWWVAVLASLLIAAVAWWAFSLTENNLIGRMSGSF